MVRRGGHFLLAPVALAAGLCMVAFVGCGGDDATTSTYKSSGGSGGSGTGGTAGTAGTAGTSGTGGTGGGNLCGPGTTECNGSCVATDNDPANCGTCGNACQPGEVCSAGTCGMTCSGGTTECNGMCVATGNDPANCGSCGNACQPGEVCSGGTCGVTCSGGTTECSGSCVDTAVDPAHCGDCATQCGTDEVCSLGVCAVNCSGGTTECSGVCVDTNNDPAHCGDCATACNAGEVCSAGSCDVNCGGGTTLCSGACVDTNIDPDHCGDCTTVCPNGEVCSGGTCGLICTGGTTACSGSCVATDTDPANCGGCANQCPPGEVCSAGVCGLTCGGGTTLCTGTCVDTDIDPNNCGGCGTACTSSQACVAGVCANACTGGLLKCGNFCVDTQIDEANCGGCGTVCTAGQDCIAGVCTDCNSATTDCDGDGWLVADGDCCDKPGICGSEPAKVNPGAIEVIGNGVDDNCNNKLDLFDTEDTAACDASLASDTAVPGDFAKAMGICRTTTENEPLATRTWGLISAQLVRADGTAVADARGHSLRAVFGSAAPIPLEGQRVVVLSTGIASDSTQTTPGPNGGPTSNVSTDLAGSGVNIQTCTDPLCIKDWYATPNPPLKPANGLPDAPGCAASDSPTANDSIMLVLRMRAPTNARAFSFSSYFYSAEYPEFVCTSFNDQFVALVNTPSGTPTPIANPVDKNLMTYTNAGQKWPIGINIAKGTSLFSVCEDQATSTCWDTDVSSTSCSLGAAQLLGTGFEAPNATSHCTVGGGTYWLTTAGNVIPGQIVELRISIWDVGDSIYDSLALLDGFRWLSSATLPGTN